MVAVFDGLPEADRVILAHTRRAIVNTGHFPLAGCDRCRKCLRLGALRILYFSYHSAFRAERTAFLLRLLTLDRPPSTTLGKAADDDKPVCQCADRGGPRLLGSPALQPAPFASGGGQPGVFRSDRAAEVLRRAAYPGFAQFDRWAGKRVLEIGCGLGTESVNFARAGADLTIVELSPQSLALCRQRFEVYGLSATFCEGDAERLPDILPPTEFDLIFSFGVIHHTPHPERVIAHLPGYLAADGELRIMLYSKVSYKLFWIMRETGCWDFGRMDELVAEHSEAQTGCPVTHTYTFDEIRELLHEFEVLDIRKDHIFPYEIESYRRYEYRKEACWEKVSAERFRQLERELGWHTLVRACKRPAD